MVCTGNICRSPMAAAALRAKLFERRVKGVRVTSAGILGGHIPYPPQEAILAAEEVGLDLSTHRGRRLTGDMLEDSDLVLVMEKEQKEDILSQWPKFADRIFLVTDFLADDMLGSDVPDPYGAPLDYYRSIFGLIDRSLEALAQRMDTQGNGLMGGS